MATVVVASPKGGAGKSTAAVLLGTEFARAGANIVLLDCDPNRAVNMWASKAKLPPRIALLSDVDETNIVRTIKQYDRNGRILIVDLEGIASRLVSRAISQADLVLTPMRATALDASIGLQMVALIAEEEEVLERKIAHAVIFTMTRGVRSKQHRDLERSLQKQGVVVIEPPLMERAAFSALFALGGDLSTMPAQGRMESAAVNAREFAQAVYTQLKGAKHEQGTRLQYQPRRHQNPPQAGHGTSPE